MSIKITFSALHSNKLCTWRFVNSVIYVFVCICVKCTLSALLLESFDESGTRYDPDLMIEQMHYVLVMVLLALLLYATRQIFLVILEIRLAHARTHFHKYTQLPSCACVRVSKCRPHIRRFLINIAVTITIILLWSSTSLFACYALTHTQYTFHIFVPHRFHPVYCVRKPHYQCPSHNSSGKFAQSKNSATLLNPYQPFAIWEHGNAPVWD